MDEDRLKKKRASEATRRWQKRNPERAKGIARRVHLRKYGITPEQYDKMFEEQGGQCALCGMTPEVNGALLAVDHNHATGKVRALLCRLCNNGLGHFREDGDLLARAIAYLKEHE